MKDSYLCYVVDTPDNYVANFEDNYYNADAELEGKGWQHVEGPGKAAVLGDIEASGEHGDEAKELAIHTTSTAPSIGFDARRPVDMPDPV